MKLNQLFEEEAKPQYKIYVDLDGVLADFKGGVKDILGIDIDDPAMKGKMWKGINKESDEHGFWSKLKLMKDAKKLWSYLEKHNPIILSATGTSKNAPAEKKDWVERHFGHKVKVILVRDGKDKAKYASPHSIIIDDSHAKVIDPWDKAGGIGIHHQSVDNTIQVLKDIGI